jgi:hypothetical protein
MTTTDSNTNDSNNSDDHSSHNNNSDNNNNEIVITAYHYLTKQSIKVTTQKEMGFTMAKGKHIILSSNCYSQ